MILFVRLTSRTDKSRMICGFCEQFLDINSTLLFIARHLLIPPSGPSSRLLSPFLSFT